MRPALLLCLLPVVSACSTTAIDAPGLQRRPIESMPIATPETAAEEPATPADPALSRRLEALVTDAEAAHRRFERERETTVAAVARGRGAPEGGEAWVQAQQASSALAAAQGPVRETMAEIDALRSNPVNYGSGSRAAIDAAAARVAALIDEEAKAVSGLSPR